MCGDTVERLFRTGEITWPPFTENEKSGGLKSNFFYQWQPHNPLECGEHQLLAVTVTSPMSALGSPSITTLLPLATAGTPGTDEPKLCIPFPCNCTQNGLVKQHGLLSGIEMTPYLSRTVPLTSQPVWKVYQLFQSTLLLCGYRLRLRKSQKTQTTGMILDKTTTSEAMKQSNTLRYTLPTPGKVASPGQCGRNCFSAHLTGIPYSSSKLCWLLSAQKGQGSGPKFQGHLPSQCPLQALGVSGRDSCHPQGCWTLLHCPSQENLASSAFVPPLEIQTATL